MTDEKSDKRAQAARTFAEMSQNDFVYGWEVLFGEPPSIMLDDRHDMISIMVEMSELAPAYGSRISGASTGPSGRTSRAPAD